ncbi:MAG: helicase C-terminal domain-containing protein [Candidatus Brocadiia bacterium]|nr:helicase C-terminal domain-containing protein [Candidatus Brocadiia bacterium]
MFEAESSRPSFVCFVAFVVNVPLNVPAVAGDSQTAGDAIESHGGIGSSPGVCGRMAQTRVLSFVAVITTGPSPQDDGVLEVAAVKVRDGEELGRFSQLADPGPLPLAMQQLTGLDASRLAGRPAPRQALAKLGEFLGAEPAVVHGAAALGGFMEAEGATAPPGVLDSLALARIVRPTEKDYSIAGLARALGLEPPQTHRALELALVLAEVWGRLLEELKGLPGPVLDALHRVAETAADPLAPWLAAAANEGAGFALSSGEVAAPGEFLRAHREIFARAQKYKAPEPRDDALSTDKLCDMFADAGAVGRHLPGYEQRDEQVAMAREVCEALGGPHHLLCEAGTGTGKSMAYLLPGIAWACQNEDKVIVSTNTKNLQEQLYRKDLPFLHELVGERFEAALLKGRRNYLCVRRFAQLLRQFERELDGPAEMAALLPLIAWSARTESGDLAECTGLLADENARAGMELVTSGSDDCRGRACAMRERCFVRRARALAQLADIVVVNHSLLFSELKLDQPILPVYRCVVFDEAQNIEDVATRALAVSVDSLSVFRITNRLWRARRGGEGSGVISTVMYEARRNLPEGGPLGRETVIELARGVIERIDPVVELTRECMQTLGAPFEVVPAHEDKIMTSDCSPPVGVDSPTGKAAEALGAGVRGLCASIEDLAQCLDENTEALKSASERCADLRAQGARLKEVTDQLKFVLAQEQEDYVYWIERTRRQYQTFYSLHAAPLEIGRFMRSYFFEPKRSVIMTSATLRVGGKFDYLLERLGAAELSEERVRCMAVGSPFDFDRQTMVCAPTFLPEAGGRREGSYDEELSSFLIDLLKATSGRALVLFTSYSLLDAVCERIKRPLEQAGIPVLAQGRDGSREALSTMFREVRSSVLLGTQSFWEGVDFTGETLSCLVLTKLPFHVVTEPLVRGRIEYLRDHEREPFVHYTLPEAVINFRQGFGRLIRNRTDRGVIVVTDRRLVTKGYGRSFTRDLPTKCRIFKQREPLITAVKRFFARPY